ncbi:TetR/AcrR family transcriptional regulator [Alkalibacter rhizosphaerae]|uniref:TetR/AcrR family transcriptional regulator n=1 Tax=Alkalibacter rhizosphaerae TaxID=2815577 RepID=A0A974XI55_9FIRM|nr:TetR/AcrR family transcriptional regulator [Alkalibacter rhizosphaerae]QSX09180.1 TetR/AcrR family transcriptional regulator [Alkalibacter rhizosphaerae]
MTATNLDKETADRLIDKAIEIFSTKGYSATKLTDITDSLSISRGPIYYHFKDKLGLYAAAFDRFEEGLRTIHNRVFSTNKILMDQMEDMIFDFVKHISVFGDNFFFMVDDIKDLEEISKRYHTMNLELYEDKIRLVEEAQKQGQLKPTMTPKKIVDYVYLVYFAILEGINSNILESYSDEEIKEWIRIQFYGLNVRIMEQ